MNEQLKAFCDNLVYWLKTEHCLVGTIVPSDDPLVCDVNLACEDEDDDECDDPTNTFYVGSCADPGLRVRWLGAYTCTYEGVMPSMRDRELVEANGVIFEALGRQVAGWVVGYQ